MSWAEMITNIIQGLGKFITEILHYGAWPAAVLVVIYWLRKPIASLIDRCKELRHKDTVLGFDTLEFKRDDSATVGFDDVTDDTLTWNHFLDAVEQIAILVGLRVLRKYYESGIEAAKKELTYYCHYIEKIQKYRPNNFNWHSLHIVKAKIDALGLDENVDR